MVYDYEVEDVVLNQKRSAKGTAGYYFQYVTKDGRKGKLLVPLVKYDFADYLVERLNGSDVSEYERHIEDSSGDKKGDIPKDAGLLEKLFIYSNKGAILITVTVVLLLAVIFGNMFINAGRKAPYTAAQVAEVMQNYGYETIDNTADIQKENPYVKHSVLGGSAYPYVEFSFFEFDSADSAKSLYSSVYNQLLDKRNHKNPAVRKAFYNNYSSVSMHCEYDYYYEITLVSNTVMVSCSKETTKDKIYELLQTIDYDQKTDKVTTKTK